VNAEFNVWLLIVGLVVGAGLVWVVMMDGRRQETEVDSAELPREAAWLSAVLAEDGYEVSPEAAEELLLLHRAYLGAPPPDPILDDAFEDSDVPGGAEADPPLNAGSKTGGSQPAVVDRLGIDRGALDADQ
jgi:hypothetical protein